MRFDEFVLRVPGDEFRIRFHERLTVLAGVGPPERQALVAAMVGALTGEVDGTAMACIDHTGRPIGLTADRGRVTARFADDDTAAPSPVGWYAPDADSLRSLMVLTSDDLGRSTTADEREDDPPELAEARATLRALVGELDAATEGQRAVQALEGRLAELDARVRVAEGDAARREYAKVLAELERVRAEAAALQSGTHGAETDRHLLGSAEEAHRLAARWADLAASTRQARVGAELAASEGLEPADIARLIDVPDSAPADLPLLVAELAQAGNHVTALEDRLREVASASLPEPADPRVLTLATTDQDELWSAHDRFVEAGESVTHEQVALGGIGADGDRADAIEELESAHAAFERASALVERRRVLVIGGASLAAVCGLPLGAINPLFGLALCAAAVLGTVAGIGRAWRARASAGRREAAVLEQIGVSTYLAFHLRRIDATLDPSALDRLGLAEAEASAARRAWASVAGTVEVSAAAALRAEVTSYADALAAQHGAIQEVTELRRTLDELALPDLTTVRDRVLLAVEPYGLDGDGLDCLEPELVIGFVDRQVVLGHAARQHRSLADAEADEEKVAIRLEDLLVRLGFAEGGLDARVGGLDWAVERAKEREAARVAARPRETVEDDLHRLNAEVRRLRRPEWTEVSPTEAAGPDAAELEAQRVALHADLATARQASAAAGVSAADVERLADRRAAVERRVAALEVQLRGEVGDSADIEEIQQYLLAGLTRANRVGPRGEPVPVLLDDPFVRVPADRTWEMMDLLRRLSEKTQVLYLTDDPFIGAWARRRADAGEISLLEPVD